MSEHVERWQILRWPDRESQALVADSLVAALAVALPWSTSITEILVWMWFITVIPTIDVAALRRILTTPAGGLPVLLFALGLIGTLWAFDVPMKERLDGFKSFYKLLFIPLLIVHFLRSARGVWVMYGYLFSCCALLVLSGLTMLPGWPWQGRGGPGTPARDYIAQAPEFTVCIFLIAKIAVDASRDGRRRFTLSLMLLAAIFLIDVLYISISRTALVMLPILLLLFAATQLPRKSTIVFLLAGLVLCGLTWFFAPSAKNTIVNLYNEVIHFDPSGPGTRAGERLVFWEKSIRFVATAPIVGHGIGSIRDQFRKTVDGQTGMAALVASNPHNQTLAVAIQLGLAGTVVLWGMWLAHWLLFRGDGLIAWAGILIVTQNFIGSLFNSHLFDFAQGWGYVIGVGTAAGLILKKANSARGDVPYRAR